jgi:transposase
MTHLNNTTNYCYAGIDLHKKYSYITVLDSEDTIVLQDTFVNNQFVLQKALLQLNAPIKAAVEATFNATWLVDTLESVGIPTVVIHPTKFKAIAQSTVKTDKIDSYKIAENLKTNNLPLSYIPTVDEQCMKDIVRLRFSLVSERSKLKTKLKFILLRNCMYDFPYTDIAGKKSQKWLQTLQLKMHEKEMIQNLLDLINELTAKINGYESKIKELVDMNLKAKLLMTIPGIGHILALTLIAEIGTIERFKRSKYLQSYAGLVPSTYSSGGKTTYGSLTKQGSKFIRYALSEAINHTIKANPTLKIYYEQKSREKGKSKAKITCMCKLLKYVYIMLKLNIPYNQLDVAQS